MSDQIPEMEVEDIQVFEILNNPLRLRILRQLLDPRSVREVAEALDVPPTRLYYHFDQLEKAGVIMVVETRKVGAMLQKLYQTVARSFRPSPKLVEGDHEPDELARIAAAVVLDGARLDAEASLVKHFERLASGTDFTDGLGGSLGRSIAYFTRERADAFGKKLEALIEETFDESHDEEGVEYAFSFTFFPVAGTTLELTE
jgi:DNA-binding transcriptional ArsR family regulator